jgi:hypothetical protein
MIPESRYGRDPRTIELEIKEPANIGAVILNGGKDELLCPSGDPDNERYIRFSRLTQGG